MCGDSHLPPAPESGDLIAVIHPNSHSAFCARLKLSNRMPGATVSTLQCKDSMANVVSGSKGLGGRLNVRIHKYGQPLSLSHAESDSEDEGGSANPVLHSFFVHPTVTSTTGDQRLHLGVGGDGVVGRTVSIFDGNRILGEGVIGWS